MIKPFPFKNKEAKTPIEEHCRLVTVICLEWWPIIDNGGEPAAIVIDFLIGMQEAFHATGQVLLWEETLFLIEIAKIKIRLDSDV